MPSSHNSTFNNVVHLLEQTLSSFLSNLTQNVITSISKNILSIYLKYKSQVYIDILTRITSIYDVHHTNGYFVKWKGTSKHHKALCNNSKKVFSPSTASLHVNSNTSHNGTFYEELSMSNYKPPPTVPKTKRNKLNNKSLRSNSQITTTYNINTLPHNIGPTLPEGYVFSINKFMKRQELYHQLQSLSKEKILQDNEDEYNLLCTFVPKINKTQNVENNVYVKSSSSAHMRLYNDGLKKMNKKDEIEKENIIKEYNINTTLSKYDKGYKVENEWNVKKNNNTNVKGKKVNVVNNNNNNNNTKRSRTPGITGRSECLSDYIREKNKQNE